MNNHISSRSGGTDTTEPDETPQRPRRFTDQRGIALQTVIIMVVLLAIAGGIAAVLLSRGGDAANQLENQSTSVPASSYENETLCKSAGYDWDGGEAGTSPATAKCAFKAAPDCERAGGTHDATADTCTISGTAHRATN